MNRFPRLLLLALMGLNLHMGSAQAGGAAIPVTRDQPCPMDAAGPWPPRTRELIRANTGGGTLRVWQRFSARCGPALEVAYLRGTTRWQRVLPGSLSIPARQGEDWGVTGGALWLETGWSGDAAYQVSQGVDLRTGRSLWSESGSLRYRDEAALVVKRDLGTTIYSDLKDLDLTVFDLRRGTVTRRSFQIADRPGCGDTEDFVREDAAFGATWFDAANVYARRKDACGVFVVKVRWRP